MSQDIGNRRVATAVHLSANGVAGVTATADQSHPLVTYGLHGWRTIRTAGYDVESGKRVTRSIDSGPNMQVSAKGVLVMSEGDGDITEMDTKTLKPVATFPAARGAADSLQFSADGSVLAATSGDQTVQLYDVATRIRFGDAIKSAAHGVLEGFLRPNRKGRGCQINGPDGVVEWDLDPDHLAAAACNLACRNLTRTEWATYFPSKAPTPHLLTVRLARAFRL